MFQFDADLKTVDTGIWMDFQGSSFLIAHISNMRFQRSLARLQQPHRRKINEGTLDPRVNKDLLCKAMSEGILLDWRNVGGQGAKDVPYTQAAAYTALSKNPEFRDFVSDVATSLANYRTIELEEAGND